MEKIKSFLNLLGFTPKENAIGVFSKKYANNFTIEIDEKNQQINYGVEIKSESKTTSNFSQAENFVVLECVNRLLEKGYKPENITLEKTWGAGHGTSGRLDICVAREDGSEYLLIECKTYGKEFEKEFTRMKKDGGQLFTYFKFSNKADVILLYASELNGTEIIYRNEIVKIEEDYRTGDVKDFYDKWSKLTKDNGVFENWTNPYNFESKALTISDLEEIKQEDSSFIFNRFLEILRHNVVSDKGNAFNRIFTLFLCKIYDEKDKEGSDQELEFQWFESPFDYEGVHYEKDTHVTFQSRLTDLYKKGMKDFLEKNVTDFSESEFNNKYSFLTEEQRNPILKEFRKVRLEKNNEFAIKDVYDEQSFFDNAIVVKEIVELLQGFKLRYTKKQQYLSDFFELLLTTGLKQESGQFFTPVPVAQFVIKSLPIDTIIKQKLVAGEKDEYLPYIIDYAAGSGHFLTETMHEVQRIIDNNEFPNAKAEVKRFIKQAKEYHFEWAFNYVYGIEKDYRLVKVGKVGCYLHGDGLANVIHSDGLANFAHKDYKGKLALKDKNFEQENKQFDIIASNPPYSVSAFKNAARQFYKDIDFDLYDKLTDNSSEIECLFIERTKQLLKDGGVAGIILPSSILSNTGIYSKSREIILQYFDIVGITELGSNTFMATGTNTVTLFLRRRNNYESVNIKIAVNKFFNDFQDVTLNGIEKPVSKYINHVWDGISSEDYITLLKKVPNKKVAEIEIYKEYCKKIKAYSQIKFLEDQIKDPENLKIREKLIEKKDKAEKEFWTTLLDLEKEKVFYFILAYSQKVVLIKSGEKDAEKRFLGYEFSNRRGSEGIHPIQRGKNIEDCTQLFDADVFDNPTKASTYIYKAFAGDFDFPIDITMQGHVSRHNLVDIMTFDRVEFEKNISLSVKKKVKIESKWEVVDIANIAKVKNGFAFKSDEYVNDGLKVIRIKNVKNGYIEDNEPVFISLDREKDFKEYKLRNEDILVSMTGNPGRVAKIKEENLPALLNQRVGKFEIISKNLLKDYFYHFINTEYFEKSVVGLSKGLAQLNVSSSEIESVKIPLPPLDIQQKIVSEIEDLETKEKKAKREVEKLKSNLYSIFNAYPKGAIHEICKVSDKKENPQSNFKKEYIYLGLEHIESNTGKIYINKEFGETILSTKNVFDKGDILYGKLRPYLNKVAEPTFAGICSTDILVLKTGVPKILKWLLLSQDLVAQTSELMKGVSLPRIGINDFLNQKVPLPPLSEQQKIVSEIEKIEEKIKALATEIADIPKQKELILKKYL